jgi:hypothetical protein
MKRTSSRCCFGRTHLFDAFFTSIESWGPIGKVVGIIPHHGVLNLSGLVIAFIVAALTHMFHFHDLISDVFGIRRRFDRKTILIPLAKRVGSAITKDKEAKIAQRRDELMHSVFYKYASSRANNPLVDKHDIEHALNQCGVGSGYWSRLSVTSPRVRSSGSCWVPVISPKHSS